MTDAAVCEIYVQHFLELVALRLVGVEDLVDVLFACFV
jgi:hypothetical protein